jgi:hypothetical protein
MRDVGSHQFGDRDFDALDSGLLVTLLISRHDSEDYENFEKYSTMTTLNTAGTSKVLPS